MALIPLNGRRSNGQCAIVDDCDVGWMSGYNWHLAQIGYVYGRPKNGGAQTKFLMHRLVMGAQHGQIVDHRNGNRLDNRRENLRFCTESENKANRGRQRNGTSQYRGVTLDKRTGTWDWGVQFNGQRLRGSGYASPEDAARDRDDAAKQLHGEFAVLNFQAGGNDGASFQVPGNLPQVEKQQYQGVLPSGVKAIPLTRGYFAFVDESDCEWLNKWIWCFAPNGAMSRESMKTILMHRLIAQTPDDMVCDHIDGNNLNNARSNLRNCDKLSNTRNSKQRKDSKFPYKGVFQRASGTWGARIRNKGAMIHLGTFPTALNAARAYDSAAREMFGEFARPNFPDAEL